MPGEGQVLVAVRAAALNPLDLHAREGYLQPYFPLSLPVTIGGDFSGEVVALGQGVTGWRVGDRVYGMASAVTGSSGSLAEYAAAGADQIALKPRSATDPQAAAAVLAGVSAVQAMDDTLHPAPGHKVLIHGGSGGIGSLAIQYARHLGAHVATTVRAPHRDFSSQLGADEIVDYERQPFEAVLHDYDAVLDLVGGDTYERSFEVLRPGGVIVSLLEQPNEALMARHNVRAVMQWSKVTTARLDRRADLIDRGVLKVVIDRVFALDQAGEACDRMERGHPRGKVAVEIR